MGYFIYCIVFKNKKDSEYKPILEIGKNEPKTNYSNGTMHLLDDDMFGLMSTIEYLMHLPRNIYDLCDIDEELMSSSYDTSHIIVPYPESELANLRYLIPYPTLIVTSEECSPQTKEECKKHNPTLGTYETKELTKSLLKVFWKKLIEIHKPNDVDTVQDIDKHFLLENEYLKALPLLDLDRQFSTIDNTLNKIFNTENLEKECINIQWNNKVRLNTLVNMSNHGIDIKRYNFEDVYNQTYQSESQKFDVSVVITFPGVSKKQFSHGISVKNLSEVEKRTIRILGVHRAIARRGVIVELPTIREDLFNKYNELEERCKNGTNNKYVWRSLNDLGKLIGSYFNDMQINALKRAKDITIFSDFPVGLAIFEGEEMPLQCYKSISYRPLTPLTRQLQTELSKTNQHYLGKGVKIAIAECIFEQDSVYKACELAKVMITKLQDHYPDTTVHYQKTYTVEHIKQFIKDNIDADILYISAHGHYDKTSNMAGIMVGDEFWMASDDIIVPSIVILSACHTSPRGIGAVNIADLFIRNGAITVLSTFIPVNALRNTTLMTRLFTYICEGQNKSKQYRTLSDAWSGIVASNAIHELMHSSERFKIWMHGKNSKGKVRVVEFQLERCVGRLRNTHIYSDTIAIIEEMLAEEDMVGKFGDIINMKNVFPESFFYQLIGSPENIFLYNEIFEKYHD